MVIGEALYRPQFYVRWGLALVFVVACPALGLAQPRKGEINRTRSEREAAPTAAQNAEAAASRVQGTWSTRCISNARKAPVTCVIEQNALIARTGQLVASVGVRLASDAKEPILTVQVPVGLYVPGGIRLQVDEKAAEVLPIETCDLKGCFSQRPMSAASLAAIEKGKKLTVSFENLSRQMISIPFGLERFAEAYNRIR